MTDLVGGGPDYTEKFQLPLHYLIRHLWSVRGTKPNSLFDPDVVREFEATLKHALDAMGDLSTDDRADDATADST